jgi:hypothetical protein
MATRTLYVSDQDEQIWEQARALSGGETAESLSKLVTDGLRLLLEERRAAVGEAANDNGLSAEDAQLVARFRRDLQRTGWQRAGQAFARACIDYGAARSRAARKAHETMGLEGRQAAARKAHDTMGPEGRQAAARKAQATKGLEGRKRAAQKAAETRRRNVGRALTKGGTAE